MWSVSTQALRLWRVFVHNRLLRHQAPFAPPIDAAAVPSRGLSTSQHIVLEPQSWRVQVSGEVLTPEPKVLELLAYSMRNPGRVVSKAELLDSL